MTVWGNVRAYGRKITKVGEIVIACSGDVELEMELIQYLEGKIPVWKPHKRQGIEFIKIEDKKAYWSSKKLAFIPLEGFFAIGSGWELAMMAMQLGRSAEEAIKEVSKCEINTNDIVDTYNVKTKKLTLAPFPK